MPTIKQSWHFSQLSQFLLRLNRTAHILIDQLVYVLYDLTVEEIALIEMNNDKPNSNHALHQ